MDLNILDEVQTKMLSLESRLQPVETERIPVSEAWGRILGEPIVSFRDSPALDLSAMDGYAVRRADLVAKDAASSSDPNTKGLEFPVVAVATAGGTPKELGVGQAIRIFTGGVVPQGADVVIPRERCRESADHVVIAMPLQQIPSGWNIRRRAENAPAGSPVLQRGVLIDGPRMSSIVSMHDQATVQVYRRVKVAIINTGDELLALGQPIEPWQIRDSNGPLLEAMLRECPWIEFKRTAVRDDPVAIQRAIADALVSSDAVLLTGGVSMGDTDHVPEATVRCGGEIIFHRLPIRPGAPILGAATESGQLILGLPGNPVSVAVTFRRFGLGLLDRIGGKTSAQQFVKTQLANGDHKSLHLVWYRLVVLQPDGTALLLPNQGSGDVVGMGLSDGFIEVPAGTETQGSFFYYDWKFC